MTSETVEEGQSKAMDRASMICRAIRRAILERALMPGDKLPEDQLGERFGVSRTLARHALGQLASEGLVELRRNRIAVVATPSFEDARDEFDIRVELERLVVKHLAGRLSSRQLAELSSHVEAEEQARNGPEAASLRLATEFHVRLAEMTGRPTLSRYVRETAYRSCLSLAAFGRPHSSECAISEHREVLSALESGDAARASQLMAHHLEQVAQRALLKAPDARGDLMDILAPYAEMEAPSARGRRRIADEV